LSEDFWLKVNFAEQEATRFDYDIKHLKLEPTSELKTITEVVEQDADIKSVLLIPPDSNIEKDVLADLDAIGLPITIVGSVKPVSSLKNVHIIDQDRKKTATLAIKLLLDKGHTKIGYIANEPWSFASQQFKKGMQNYLRDLNLPIRNLVQTELKP
jgi:DNA-binding LacI/PurR family transcriptional regulator